MYNSSPRHRRSGARFSRSRGSSSSSRGQHSRGDRQSHSGGKSRSKRRLPTFNPSQFINTNPVDQVVETYVPKHTFATFGLTPKLAANIAAQGITAPTAIQDQIIPEVLNGHDVIGLAQTGTGKTAAFLVPLIERTLKSPASRTLVLAPTRELALQIDAEFKRLAEGLQLYSVLCVGGVDIRPQVKALRRPYQFVIGTPGRVFDLIDRKQLLSSRITNVVLDEADRMLDMGFINDMRKILDTIPRDRSTLFFSATMPAQAEGLVHDFLRNPVTISVKKKDVTNSIEQDVVRYHEHSKYDSLVSLLDNPELRRVIIFGSMKHSVERLARQLTISGIHAESIHGNKSHSQRQRALQKFKSGNTRVLVATDVAARGIHVDSVSHVINYDLPNTFEDYVHRIGRTGRGTEKGKALTFVPLH